MWPWLLIQLSSDNGVVAPPEEEPGGGGYPRGFPRFPPPVLPARRFRADLALPAFAFELRALAEPAPVTVMADLRMGYPMMQSEWITEARRAVLRLQLEAFDLRGWSTVGRRRSARRHEEES